MKHHQYTTYPLVVSVITALIIFGILRLSGRTDKKVISDINLRTTESLLDTMMLSTRHSGPVNLEKFLGLVNELDTNLYRFTDKRDSIKFGVRGTWTNSHFRTIFFNDRSADNWETKYANLPISVITQDSKLGFSAKLVTIDSIEYLHIPYEVLFSVAEYTHRTSSQSKNAVNISTEPEEVTIQQAQVETHVENLRGNLIQTEGIVWRHVSDLIAHSSYGRGSQAEQLCFLWKYARDENNWNYIHDPAQTMSDRWRPASTTIETYYSSGRKYSGDCDDFAILMASFARQIGYRSRFVGAYGTGGQGHAFAEFFVPDDEYAQTVQTIKSHFNLPASARIGSESGRGGKWINMDWWGDYLGGAYWPELVVRKAYPNL